MRPRQLGSGLNANAPALGDTHSKRRSVLDPERLDRDARAVDAHDLSRVGRTFALKFDDVAK